MRVLRTRVRVGRRAGVVLALLALAAIPCEAQADSDPDALVGTPAIGSPGITETVDELMARDGAAAAKPPTETATPPQTDASTSGTSFRALGSPESGFVPPDTAGDVGPTQILVHVNGRVAVFSKSGVLGALNVTAASFWSSVADGSEPVLPQVRYDRLSGRWILMAVNSASTKNRVLIAVQTNPGEITGSSSFTFYQFDQTSGGGSGDNSHRCEYPTLGIDNSALYIGCDMFNNGGSFKRVNVYVVRKSSLIPAPGTLVVTAFRNISNNTMGPGPASPVGVDNDNPQAGEGYFIGVDVNALSLLQLRRVGTPGGTPTLSGNLALTVPATVSPISQPASGSTTNLDAGDDRLVGASLHTNKITGATTLWTSHANQVNASCVSVIGGGRNGARWYEIAGSAPTATDPLGGTPALVQSGTLCDSAASDPTGYIYPSVTGTGQGHMVLGSSFAATNLFAGAAAAGRLRIDPAGATQAATTAQSGLASYTLLSSGLNRWGDYSFTSVDPNDDQTVWTFQEYADSPANNWAVRAVLLMAPPPPTLTGVQATVCAGLASTIVTLTGTTNSPVTGAEFFDPGPDTGGPGYANHIAASVTGGVTLSGAPSIVIPGAPSTQSVLQVSVPINTTASAAGLKDVTITNPDGQTTTGIGILQISGSLPPPASNNGPVCAGATLALSAATVADATYSWTGPNGFTSALQNPTIPNVTGTASGTYSVTVLVSGCTSQPSTTTVVVIDESAPCDDGNACTTADTCGGGTCNGGPAPVCDDSNLCTADSCNPASGCVFTDVSAACDDGNACTDDSCNPALGCINTNNTGACSDGNACTAPDTCSGGACISGSVVVCDDNSVCTTDSCNPATGCVFTDTTAVACNDGNVCTDDACDPVTGCFNPNNTASCEDGDACTTGDTCSGGSCQTGAGTLNCDDNNVCTQDSCNSPAGCVYTNVPGACDDGNACTTADTCGGGTCNGGPALVCDDTNLCTADSCNPASGCVNTDISASCNDSNVCTDDSCNPALGCINTNNTGACCDGNACTTTDTCGGGTCNGGPALVCNDNNVCTADSCNPASGCVFTDTTAVACNDGNVCTDDACDPVTGCFNPNNTGACSDGNACTTGDTCSGGICQTGAGTLNCDDNNLCTPDSCNPASGCVHIPSSIACNDNNVCTNDDCIPNEGCTHSNNTAACEDGNLCTAGDTCSAGNCNSGSIVICNDNNVCTTDTCVSATGCVHADVTAFACNDFNACTDDLCNSVSGCFHTDNTASCQDGNACTTGDTCGGGSCQTGAGTLNCDDSSVCTDDSCNPASGCVFDDTTAVACNDGNVCTDDACNPVTGCFNPNNTASCQDGNACTTGDTCSGGSCQTGAGTLNCNDSNVCTDDSCNPASGCVTTNVPGVCSDGNACTTGDTCGGGTCNGGPPPVCDDTNLCTADSCNPASGCVNTDTTAACNDSNVCTSDSCDTALGCINTNNTGACSDGNACTTGDTCSGGICQTGTGTLNCNDNNVCTSDSCNPASGCGHANNTVPCDDDNICTTGDTCDRGVCQQGTPLVCDDSILCTNDSCDEASGCVHVVGPPLPVAGVSVNGHTTTTLTWAASLGSAVYDVATSTLGDLHTNGTSTATCLSNDVSGAAFTDTQPDPVVSEGYYYLVRVQNECGQGNYGTDAAGVDRAPTAACP